MTHKTEVGGVLLNLADCKAVQDTFGAMYPAMKSLDPDAGVTVQPVEADGFELMLGATRLDGTPLIAVGMGGIYAEALKDMAFRLAPLEEGETERMLHSLRCAPILDGFRTAPMDQETVGRMLQRLAELLSLIHISPPWMQDAARCIRLFSKWRREPHIA